ncbi:MAG TPA: hypothetical protein PK583_00890 [Gammaproteobacteria bacterium]|nr:hypothetical protein [Gammaproteobacteria bacterium]
MIKLTVLQAFHAFYSYILADYESKGDLWIVDGVLSDADTNLKIACHSGGPTADPAMWKDWEFITEEALQNKSLHNNGPQKILLTREQILKVMECFLETRYWHTNHDSLLKDTITDIQDALTQADFESTEVWQQWLECVPKGLAFKEIFDDGYFEQLEKMRQQFWEIKYGKPWNEIVNDPQNLK